MELKKVISLCILTAGFSLVISCSKKSKKTESNSENKEVIADEKAITKVDKPNVIVILIDDAGYADFGFMGSQDLKTPNIDKLAASGVVFTDAHVSATVCAPSRAGLISGQYQQRFGFEANGTGDEKSGDIGLADNVVTIADVLKKDGYATMALGKWHLGGEQKSDHPNQRGFDEFYGFLTGSRSYFPLEKPSVYKMLQHNGERVVFEGYMTDVLGDRSVKYIEENKNNPFFMYLAYNAVHTPMEATEEDLKLFAGHPRQKLAAMTWSLDKNVGKLMDKLKVEGILDNTLIYFLSDNGGAHNNSSSMGELKGWKGNKFEGGHRVPFVLSWPKKVKGNQRYDGLSSSLDIFATSIAAAGISSEELKLDGVDLIPHITGTNKSEPHDELYWRKLEEAAVRKGDHKLIRIKGAKVQKSVLYNLKNDISETIDLSKKQSDDFESLHEDLEKWETTISDPLWVEARGWMDVTFHIHEQLMKNEAPIYKSPGGMKTHENKNK